MEDSIGTHNPWKTVLNMISKVVLQVDTTSICDVSLVGMVCKCFIRNDSRRIAGLFSVSGSVRLVYIWLIIGCSVWMVSA